MIAVDPIRAENLIRVGYMGTVNLLSRIQQTSRVDVGAAIS